VTPDDARQLARAITTGYIAAGAPDVDTAESDRLAAHARVLIIEALARDPAAAGLLVEAVAMLAAGCWLGHSVWVCADPVDLWQRFTLAAARADGS
jgi:hypothetical protein